jgi:ferredoxin
MIGGMLDYRWPKEISRRERTMITQYDYTNQAWIVNNKYQACGHRGKCLRCYGTVHEGEAPAKGAEIHPTLEEMKEGR